MSIKVDSTTNSTVQLFDEHQFAEKRSICTSMLSVGAATAVALGANAISSIFIEKINKKETLIFQSMTKPEINLVNKYVDIGIKHKSLKIIDVSPAKTQAEKYYACTVGKKQYSKIKRQINFFENSILKSATRKIPQKDIHLFVTDAVVRRNYNFLSPQIRGQLSSVIKGDNAYAFPLNNKAFINRSKGGVLTAFHEVGHIKNGASSIFLGKMLSLLVPLIFACSVFKKSEKDSNKNGVFNFIKEHCFGLTMLTQLPILFDEGAATIRGVNLAKKSGMNKDLIKKMKIANGKGFLTYLTRAIFLAGGIFAGSKIRDAI